MKILLTEHAKEKLRAIESRAIGIDKKKIVNTVKKPLMIDKSMNPHRSIGKLSEILSLAVIWKEEDGIIKIITFYPAEKGRYENKVLRRR